MFVGKRKEKLECSNKSEHILEETKDHLQTQCWKTWLKGLFKMRTMPRIISWVCAANLQKNNKEGAHVQEPMNNFKLGSLMQDHRLMKMKLSMTSPKLAETEGDLESHTYVN